MKSLKKSVITVLVIGTLSVAGMAFAQPHGNGQNSPMGPFGGHHQMMGQRWNSDNLPPAPEMPNGATCFGQKGPMGWQPAPFPPAFGQGFGHRGGPRQERGFAPAFGNPGCQGPRMGQFQPCARFAPDMPQGFCGQGFGHGRGPAFGPESRGPRGERFQHFGRFSPDMPQEIRTKAVEAAKLRIDLENVLSQKPLNREKAIELNEQIGKLKQEIKAWRFEQKLDRIEEFNKKVEEKTEGK